jgi:hypothetical protein
MLLDFLLRFYGSVPKCSLFMGFWLLDVLVYSGVFLIIAAAMVVLVAGGTVVVLAVVGQPIGVPNQYEGLGTKGTRTYVEEEPQEAASDM